MYKRFKKYGTIESVEVLKKPNEAYVTFKHDRAACLAYLLERNNGTEIAYTWHQPKQVPPIMKLNDDSFFALFDRCDNQSLVNLSETCKRFAGLLKNEYKFQKIDDTFCIEFDEDNETFSMTLADARKILALMGPKFRKLCIDFFSVNESLLFDEMALRYLQQIAKYCTNIKEMVLDVNMETLPGDDFVTLLAPIFENLDKFKIRIVYFENANLADYFPQLKKLCIYTYFPPGIWPTVQSITFRDHVDVDDMCRFFEMNPQLKRVKFADFGFIDNLVEFAPNIEKISFVHNRSALTLQGDTSHLADFNHLTMLTLEFLNSSQISNALADLTNLKQLKLHFADPRSAADTRFEHNESLIGYVQANQNLERLDLVKWKLDEKMVVDIVRQASKLTVFHIHKCEIYATKSLIEELSKERKTMLGQADKLQLFFDKDGKNDFKAVQEVDAMKYLDVKWNCKHDYLRK